MKKIVSILCMLALILSLVSLAACGRQELPDTSGETKQITQNPEDTSAATQNSGTSHPESSATTEPQTPAGPAEMKIAALKGPTGMGLAKLMQDAADGKTKNSYTFELLSDPTTVSAAVIKGEVDIACVPVNLASTLYAKTNGEYICLAINTLGVLHILENGNTVQSIADLAGKTLYATGQGSTPEYILNYILTKNGIADQVTVEYKTEHSELAALLAAGSVTLGMLPEPNVSSAMAQNADLRAALDLTAEWDKVCETSAVQGCVIINKAFAAENTDAVEAFMEEYAASVAFCSESVSEAAALCETFGIVPKAAIAQKAYPNCNIVFITGEEMKASLSAFLEVLYEANPASIGGALPEDDFYYTAK